MAAPVAVLTAVTKTYSARGESVVALDRVDLAVEAGDYIAVMGPSGSGKSTLLNLIGGIDRPSGGSIEVCGQRIDRLPERKLLAMRRSRVAFVFQEARLMLSLTAIENVMLPTAFCGEPGEARRRALDLLDRVGLKARADHMVHQLSGGEAQRVCIARALMTRPAIILADEPTGNLDHKTRLQICELLEGVRAAEGCSIVLVTHDPEVAGRARRALHLRDGRLEAAA